MINEILGMNIRKHRLAHNWTQEKLADALCISHQIISKWENGITTPDITALCSIAGIFRVSIDALCGISQDRLDGIISEMETQMQQIGTSFDKMYAKWNEIDKVLNYHPADDRLLFTALRYLRSAHDRSETDVQKDNINAEILKISERLLDFSRNDEYRSYANYNLAIYYHEQINMLRGSEQDVGNSKKAKKYAQLVLYKDMHKTYYHLFGAASPEEDRIALEKTLAEMLNTAKDTCKNLIRRNKGGLYGFDKSNIYAEALTQISNIEALLAE